MKHLFLCVFFPLFVLAQVPQDQKSKAYVSGVVTAEDGTVLAGARVTMIPNLLALAPQAMAAMSQPPPVVTDEKGKFNFEGILPGPYLLAAELTGFITQGYGAPTGEVFGSPIVIKQDEKIADLRIRMARQGVLSGRVRDADGEPAQGVKVFAVRWSYASNMYPIYNGTRRLQQAGMEDTADDQGGFRITGLPPGRYFVYAQPSRARGGPEPGPGVALPTYAPNALDVAGAVAVDVFAGGASQADIRLRQDGKYTVRGKVTGPAGPAAGIAVLLLDPADTPAPGGSGEGAARARASRTPFAAQVKTDDQGNFELRGVPPGTHRLFATGTRELNTGPGITGLAVNATSGTGGSAMVEFTVRDQDLDDVAVRLVQGGEASFTVRFEGERAANTPQVNLIPEQGISLGGGQSRFAESHEISPGRYYLNLSLPRGYFIKSLRLGGQDITGKAIIVSAGAADVDILLAPGAGKVTGSLADREGRPIASATVSLWPVPPDLSRQNGGTVIVTSASDGSFTHNNVAPGEYYVAAFEGLPESGLGQYPPFLVRFTGQAERVKVALNGTATANVKLIPRADVTKVVDTLPQ